MNTLYQAIDAMRRLTKESIPFSFECLTHNATNGTSKGYKNVNKALLRTGLSQEQSNLHELLIGYTDLETGKHGWFYLPLLTKFNNLDL